jgi:hypothetical protein
MLPADNGEIIRTLAKTYIRVTKGLRKDDIWPNATKNGNYHQPELDELEVRRTCFDSTNKRSLKKK